MESILTWTTIPRHGSCPGVLLIYPVTRTCMGPSLEYYWYTQWQEYANKQIKEMFSFTQWLLCLEWDFVFTSFLCWIFDWFDLAQVLFMKASSLWVDTCIILLCLENTISNESSITHPGSYNFFTASSAYILRGGFWWKYPFRAQYFNVFQSAICPVVILCINFYLLQEETSVMRVDRCTNLWISSMSLGVISIDVSCIHY